MNNYDKFKKVFMVVKCWPNDLPLDDVIEFGIIDLNYNLVLIKNNNIKNMITFLK